MLTVATRRTTFRTALAAITVAGALAWGPPASAADPDIDDVPRLAELVRTTNPWEIDALVRAEPRFAGLGEEDRRRLLATFEEPVKLWAPLLNLYPGFGIGSMAEGDRRGVWVAFFEGAAVVGVTVGLITAGGDSFTETPEQRRRRTQLGSTIAISSLGVLAVTRVISVTLPFTFHGSRHASLDRALSRSVATAPRVTAWMAPISNGPDRALQAGATLIF